MKRVLYIILGLALLVCLTPLFGVLWSSWFADRHGCILHEGFVNPCIVNGVDRGPDLYSAFVMGWFMLLTLPIGAGIALVLLVMALVDLVRLLRGKRSDAG